MREHMTARIEALVVGAGPIGLVMACELARHRTACRIIDMAPAVTTLSKAIAIQSRTLEVFEQMGIVQEALNRGLKAQSVNFYAEGRHLAQLSLAELKSPYPFLVDLAQSETEGILDRHLESLGVQVERQVELLGFTQQGDAVTARLRHADGNEEAVTTSWLIGCDGAHSTTRHLLGMPFSGEAFPKSFALADVRLHWSLPDNELHFFLHPDGVLTAFPLPGGRYRLIVETAADAAQGNQPTPTLEDFQRYFDERGPRGTIVSDPVWMAPFRINSRKVERYRQGRVFLAGDAAHIHSPAGGQGMNTGMQDAYNLAWKLALVNAGRAAPSLLDTYDDERSPVAQAVLRQTDALLKMATLKTPISQHLRTLLLPFLAQQEVVQQRMREQIAELDINYRKSPLTAEHHSPALGRIFNHGPRAGDTALDAGPLLPLNGTTTRLFEVLRDTRFTLLLFAGTEPTEEPWQQLETLAESVNTRYSDLIQFYLVVAGDSLPQGITARTSTLRDPERALSHVYKANTQCLYLLRPDGYIALCSRPVDAVSLWEYLDRFFKRQ
jgi:2-polyprenyl-6-methoxyphenol hydroxylase-like FAD-dependent oxidoreductase